MKRIFMMLMPLALFLCMTQACLAKMRQVVWVCSSQTERMQEIETLDSCLRARGVQTYKCVLDYEGQTLASLADSLHTFLGQSSLAHDDSVVLFSVEDCSYVVMREALRNDNVRMLSTLSGRFLNGDDYLYNLFSIQENARNIDDDSVDMGRQESLRRVYTMIQGIKRGENVKIPREGSAPEKECMRYLSSHFGRSVILNDSEYALGHLTCPVFSIYSKQDKSWDFLSHQEFLQTRLNDGDAPYETYGPLQYGGDLLSKNTVSFLLDRMMNLYDATYEK